MTALNPPAPPGQFPASLLGGTSVESFLSEHWEARHLYAPGAIKGSEGTLFSAEDADAYLARNDLRYPSVNLVKGGRTVPLAAYTRKLRIGSYEAFDLIDCDRVIAEYAKGATVVLQLMQNSFASAGTLATELTKFFRCRIDVHAFITPPSAQGLSAHYDTASAFLVQIRGRKSWKLFETEMDVPLSEHTFNADRGVTGGVVDEIVMAPGDVLYLPRGLPHEGVALGEASTHLTVVLFPLTWVDLLGQVVRVAEDDDRFLRSAPIEMVGESIAPDRLSPMWNELTDRLEQAAARSGSGIASVQSTSTSPADRLGRYAPVQR